MSAILEYRDRLKTALPLAPRTILVDKVDEKRMRNDTLSKALDELYNTQFPLTSGSLFSDIEYCFSWGGNYITLNYLAGIYGKIAKQIKAMQSLLKKHKNIPELEMYYNGSLFDVNVYEMMKEDFEIAVDLFKLQRIVDQRRHPDFNAWEPIEARWDNVNAKFKAA